MELQPVGTGWLWETGEMIGKDENRLLVGIAAVEVE
jgi:hypothetical protein